MKYRLKWSKRSFLHLYDEGNTGLMNTKTFTIRLIRYDMMWPCFHTMDTIVHFDNNGSK